MYKWIIWCLRERIHPYGHGVSKSQPSVKILPETCFIYLFFLRPVLYILGTENNSTGLKAYTLKNVKKSLWPEPLLRV